MSEDYKSHNHNGNPINDTSHSHTLPGDEEEFGNELGGARALLQLGNKNQPNDVDVEAAVMKLVGNIDSHSNNNNINNNTNNNNNNSNNSNNNNNLGPNNNYKKRKLQFTDEITNLNEFQQWTGFLEEELNASTQPHHHQQGTDVSSATNNEEGNENLTSEDDDAEVPFLNTDGMSSSTTPKRSRKYRKKVDSLNVDPELAHLDSNIPPSEHEQLVHAAIMSARDLENEFGPINVQAVSDYFKESQQQEQQQQQQQQQQSQEKNQEERLLQEQAAQAVVAAASQQLGRLNNNKTQTDNSLNKDHKKRKNHKKSKGLTSNENAQIVAEVVNKAHPWLTSTERVSMDLSPSSSTTITTSNVTGQQQQDHLDSSEPKKLKKQRQSISQPSSVQLGKTFSKEEVEAIDQYILAFCHINNMTREQMCQRIWSNKRQKDHFWESLQKVLPQRTRASLYKHVRRSYHIFQVRGKWTTEDDQELGRLALENPGNWKLIGGLMGRMPEDCRDRFRNYVKCGNNRSSSKWSLEEEAMLKAIVNSMLSLLEKENEQLVINWTLVSEQMNGRRSRIQCRYKWNKLTKNVEKKLKNDDQEHQDVIFKRSISSATTPLERERQLWLLGELKSIYTRESEIEWDIMYTIYPKDQYQHEGDVVDITNGQSLKIYYDLVKSKLLPENYILEQDGRSFMDEMDILMKKVNELAS